MVQAIGRTNRLDLLTAQPDQREKGGFFFLPDDQKIGVKPSTRILSATGREGISRIKNRAEFREPGFIELQGLFIKARSSESHHIFPHVFFGEQHGFRLGIGQALKNLKIGNRGDGFPEGVGIRPTEKTRERAHCSGDGPPWARIRFAGQRQDNPGQQQGTDRNLLHGAGYPIFSSRRGIAT